MFLSLPFIEFFGLVGVAFGMSGQPDIPTVALHVESSSGGSTYLTITAKRSNVVPTFHGGEDILRALSSLSLWFYVGNKKMVPDSKTSSYHSPLKK